jgi:hypothetical protein
MAYPLPDAISTRSAAAVLTQGLTALTFLTEAYAPKPGEWILVHTAAGGLGTAVAYVVFGSALNTWLYLRTALYSARLRSWRQGDWYDVKRREG